MTNKLLYFDLAHNKNDLGDRSIEFSVREWLRTEFQQKNKWQWRSTP
jgi:hypothetical protein